MNKRRLLKLADLLEANAKNKKGPKFDMSLWGLVEDTEAPMSCGTTVCAMGLAAVSGAFKRAGLGYDLDLRKGLIITMPSTWSAIGSAQELFEISPDEAEWLFMDALPLAKGAKGERQMAKLIRDFVAGKVRP